MELLGRLPQTTLIASHDLQLVQELCPRTLILADRLLAYAELLGQHGLS